MKTTQTRQPFLTPAARSRPQLFCRSTTDGSLLWAADDGLPINGNSDLRIKFPASCGTVQQDDGNVNVGHSIENFSYSVFVHEFSDMVLMVTRQGDFLTFDANGKSLATRRNLFDGRSVTVVGASNRTIWCQLSRSDSLHDLAAVDIVNGIQSITSLGGPGFDNIINKTTHGVASFGGNQAQSDGSIIFQTDSATWPCLRPDGSYKWDQSTTPATRAPI